MNHEVLYIQGIGEFIVNDSENIVFTADKNSNFSKQTYGLRPINVQPLENRVLTYNQKTLEKYKSLNGKKKQKTYQLLLKAQQFLLSFWLAHTLLI